MDHRSGILDLGSGILDLGSRHANPSAQPAASPSWRRSMNSPVRPFVRSPGPSGPAAFVPAGGSRTSAVRTSGDMCVSCHRISSSATSGRSGVAKSTACTAHAAAPNAWAPMWQTAVDWPAARAAIAAAGENSSVADRPPANRCRIASAASNSPWLNARARAIRERRRSSPGASPSKMPATRSAQSAAHAAARRRSIRLRVWGDLGMTSLGCADRPAAHPASSKISDERTQKLRAWILPLASCPLPLGSGTSLSEAERYSHSIVAGGLDEMS